MFACYDRILHEQNICFLGSAGIKIKLTKLQLFSVANYWVVTLFPVLLVYTQISNIIHWSDVFLQLFNVQLLFIPPLIITNDQLFPVYAIHTCTFLKQTFCSLLYYICARILHVTSQKKIVIVVHMLCSDSPNFQLLTGYLLFFLKLCYGFKFSPYQSSG